MNDSVFSLILSNNKMQDSIMHKKPSKFLVKTFDMISNPENFETISWTSTGEAFEIKDLGKLIKHVLPSYFRHRNLSSFIRQLNMYNFHKSKEFKTEVYSHKNFLRDQPELLSRILRKSIKKQENNIDQLLLDKYNKICSREEALNHQIELLRSGYDSAIEYNQCLLNQISHFKEREQRINQLLCRFIGQVHEVPEFLKQIYQESFTQEIVRPVPVPAFHGFAMSSHKLSN